MSIDLVTLAWYKSSLERTIVIESSNTEGVTVTVSEDVVCLEVLQPAKKRMLKTKPVSYFMLIALKRKGKKYIGRKVENTGFEPVASTLPAWRSSQMS